MTNFAVSHEDAGTRLDVYLTAQVPDAFSRSRIKSLILEGSVEVDGMECRIPNRRLHEGEIVSVEIPEAAPAEPEAEDIPLTILYEDDDMIVIDKPAGLVVHPAPGNWTGTLVNALIHHCGDSLQGIGGVRRPGIVHRLDRDTSGVMVAAKSQRAHTELSAQFADHGRTGPLRRTYLALAWGGFEFPSGRIEAPLGRDKRDRTRRAVVSAGASDAREAVTDYRVLAAYDGNGDGRADVSLVECRLQTGRTHQIRVHLAHIGHPVIGDPDYGRHFQTKANLLGAPARERFAAFRRQALHARSLRIAHPADGRIMTFEAPIPADIASLLDCLPPI